MWTTAQSHQGQKDHKPRSSRAGLGRKEPLPDCQKRLVAKGEKNQCSTKKQKEAVKKVNKEAVREPIYCAC